MASLMLTPDSTHISKNTLIGPEVGNRFLACCLGLSPLDSSELIAHTLSRIWNVQFKKTVDTEYQAKEIDIIRSACHSKNISFPQGSKLDAIRRRLRTLSKEQHRILQTRFTYTRHRNGKEIEIEVLHHQHSVLGVYVRELRNDEHTAHICIWGTWGAEGGAPPLGVHRLHFRWEPSSTI